MPLIFRIHALQRMFQRGISTEDVRHVLATGNIVEAYLDDQPYPSRLMLGWRGSRPIHVVAVDNQAEQQTIIITVYEPDLTRWEPGFERRKQPCSV
jgi:hypothetical protein